MSISQREFYHWNKAFTEVPASQDGCLKYLARMSYIALAMYLYDRKIIPRKVVNFGRFEDITFVTMNSTRWGTKISEMLKGIGEAIKKSYARQAIIMINEDPLNPDSTTEVFSIWFAYNEHECLQLRDGSGKTLISFGYKGKEEFKRQLIEMKQAISATVEKLKPFEHEITPYIKLTYYDDRTPRDYQPPAFKHCERTYFFGTSRLVVQRMIGSLSTKEAGATISIESIYYSQEASDNTITVAIEEETANKEPSGSTTSSPGDITKNLVIAETDYDSHRSPTSLVVDESPLSSRVSSPVEEARLEQDYQDYTFLDSPIIHREEYTHIIQQVVQLEQQSVDIEAAENPVGTEADGGGAHIMNSPEPLLTRKISASLRNVTMSPDDTTVY